MIIREKKSGWIEPGSVSTADAAVINRDNKTRGRSGRALDVTYDIMRDLCWLESPFESEHLNNQWHGVTNKGRLLRIQSVE